MKLSAVVQLIDGFSQAPAVGLRPKFLLNQQPYAPLAKPQAFYAFSDLEDGDYQLTISYPLFFERQIRFEVPLRLPLADAIVPCYLEPSPLYPYPAGTTLIRGQVLCAAKPLAGVAIGANYQNWRGEPKSAATQSSDYGQYDGRYALALGGKLAAGTPVDVSFSKAGYATVEKRLLLEPAAMRFVDIEMHKL
ncbi:carboxypeptidase regulatory-like domain-containing protein [Paraherbaspirillum soli]|uniref:Carboxypeptidase regulatory-like domain-containing protein n=1 Tax=Paraherbaspirillum soli TaxID=631222 RepID=A0ABW0MCJ9_9BURK